MVSVSKATDTKGQPVVGCRREDGGENPQGISFNGMPYSEEDIRDHVKNPEPVTMMNTSGGSVDNTNRLNSTK